ncbi:hypothetical protein [Inquilinus limosus]|uniref:hypothetical protein n=1 Tax=Inquilinus limosus TaxID=171674 RepID=UPI000402A0B6|nr:hypothetical protein [Inquilinus limosus]
MRGKTGLAIALGAPIALAVMPAGAAVPVRVSFGDHADFSRVAVRPGAAAVTAEHDRAHCAVVLRGADTSWQGDLAAAARLPSRRLAGAAVDAEGRLVLSVSCTAEMKTRREGGLLLLDIAAGPGGVFPIPPLPVRRPGDAPAVADAAPPPPADPAAAAASAGEPGDDTARIQAAVRQAVAVVDADPPAAPPVPAEVPVPQDQAPAVAPTPAAMPGLPVPAPAPVEAKASLAGVPAMEPAVWRGSSYAERRHAVLQGVIDEDALIDAARFHFAWGEWAGAREAASAAAAFEGPRRGEALLLDEAAALAGELPPPASSMLDTGPRDHPDWAPFAVLSWLAGGEPTIDRDDIARGLDRIRAYGPDLEAALLPRLAEAAIRGLDGDLARAALNRLQPMAAQGRVDPAALPYLRGLLALAGRQPAEKDFVAAAHLPGPWAARARLQLVEDGLRTGSMTPDDAAAALAGLAADWRGDGIEERVQRLRLDLAGRRRDPGQELSALSRLAVLAGDEAQALEWRRRFEAALDAAYDRAERRDLPPAVLVAVHARFAPEGDPAALGARTLRYARILQGAGLSLAAQDAMRAAVSLGAPDASAALAASYLDQGDGQRALQSLDGAAGDAVPALRARVLAGLDDRAAALRAIEGRQDPDSARIRAGILFAAGDWPSARAAFDVIEAGGGSLSPAERMRRAAAALRAGDAAAADALGHRLGGAAARLLSGARSEPVSITADRKAGLAALQEAGRVLATFDDVFGPDKAGAADAGG